MSYIGATRHPWPCLLFVLPLLVAYEVCVLQLGGSHPEFVRNGADNWLRVALAAGGVAYQWLPPVVLALAFVVWSRLRWKDRPGDMTGTLSGMAAGERGLRTRPVGDEPGDASASCPLGRNAYDGQPARPGAGAARLVSYLGAGIYEEALFRLTLYSGLCAVLRYAGLPLLVAMIIAATASSALFSAAHHLGPYGQPYSNYVFLFRLAAGLYFAGLYQFRGFGIAVAAHACYNVMISVGTT